MNGRTAQYKEFPSQGKLADDVTWINARLADPLVHSVEILRRGQDIVFRVWYADHLDPGLRPEKI
jgi:hypothetical protein